MKYVQNARENVGQKGRKELYLRQIFSLYGFEYSKDAMFCVSLTAKPTLAVRSDNSTGYCGRLLVFLILDLYRFVMLAK